MAFPEYFAAVKPLIVYDPLAKLLGAPEDGVITYEFADVVKLAGHACPTVAGAWLLTVRGLQALYGEELPQRYRHLRDDAGQHAGRRDDFATRLQGGEGRGDCAVRR